MKKLTKSAVLKDSYIATELTNLFSGLLDDPVPVEDGAQVNEYHNWTARQFLARNVMGRMFDEYTDKRGRRASNIERIESFCQKAVADASAAVKEYREPGDSDSRISESEVRKLCRSAERAEKQRNVANEWATALQDMHMRLLGYAYEQKQQEVEEARAMDELMNRYG